MTSVSRFFLKRPLIFCYDSVLLPVFIATAINSIFIILETVMLDTQITQVYISIQNDKPIYVVYNHSLKVCTWA